MRLGRRKIVTLKTFSRRLQDMSWRHLEDVFKTNKSLLGSDISKNGFEQIGIFKEEQKKRLKKAHHGKRNLLPTAVETLK